MMLKICYWQRGKPLPKKPFIQILQQAGLYLITVTKNDIVESCVYVYVCVCGSAVMSVCIFQKGV